MTNEQAACRQAAHENELTTDKKLIAELVEALTEVTASLAWNAHGECRAIHEGPIMPSSQAVQFARATLARARSQQ
jgi:hypothetical protein